MEFHQGFLVISVRNPRLSPLEQSGNTHDHHLSLFHEGVVTEDSVAQFPERCAGTAYTVLNFCCCTSCCLFTMLLSNANVHDLSHQAMICCKCICSVNTGFKVTVVTSLCTLTSWIYK